MMAISEAQLDTWSHQGAKVQSAATYATIKSALEDPHAPYSGQSYEVFLQGSYGNDTNVYAESDVDVVICLTSVFYDDTSDLTDDAKAAFEANRSPGSYSFASFKKNVTDWLIYKFGSGVKVGEKAIFIPGDRGRRDADVLACVEHHWYTSYRSSFDNAYRSGICFWTSSGNQIINYPKQHRDNCTSKHQATQNRFKTNVRVLKNLRNAMVYDGYLGDGVAPSYYIEGMLWNIPNITFSARYQRTIENALSWLTRCDPSQLECANERHWLIRDTAPVCWNMADFKTFLGAAQKYWDEVHR